MELISELMIAAADITRCVDCGNLSTKRKSNGDLTGQIIRCD